MSHPLDALSLVPGVSSPAEWFIVFSRRSQFWWARALAAGRYKHVSCFGRIPAVNGWMFCDFGVNSTSFAVVPDRSADGLIAIACEDDALVVKFVPPLVITGFRLRPGFTCTTAIAHLTGVPSSALRPDRFLRDCLAAGASIVLGEEQQPTDVVVRKSRAQA